MSRITNIIDSGRNALLSYMFLLLFIGLTVLSQPAFADIASGPEGTCFWVIDDDGVLTISPANGSSGTLAGDYRWDNMPDWNIYSDNITKVVIQSGTNAGDSCNFLFYNFKNCTEMDLANLDTSNATSMCSMFYGCESLTNLDLSHFNTSNVTDMSQMLMYCRSLNTVDLSSFNTSNVMDMGSMFYDCASLTSIDLAAFDTRQVNNMEQMFCSCSALTDLNLSNFNTSAVSNMQSMFQDCSALTSLDLSNFDTSSANDMSEMFNGTYLTHLNLATANGETSVAFTNYLATIVPTGFDDYATIGFWIAALGMVSAAMILLANQRKRYNK